MNESFSVLQPQNFVEFDAEQFEAMFDREIREVFPEGEDLRAGPEQEEARGICYDAHDDLVVEEHIKVHMESNPHFKAFEKEIKPWTDKAVKIVKRKYPHLAIKLLGLAVMTAFKYYRAKSIVANCSKIAFGISRCLQMEAMKT